jgi:hypothetical protein
LIQTEPNQALNGDPVPEWLENWTDVARSRWTDLVLGNGSSISVSPRFEYATLRSLAEERSAPSFSSDSNRIFDTLRSSDFEGVMREIANATRIVAALGDTTARLDFAYANIRDALIGAVAAAHPKHSEVPDAALRAANEFFSSFVSVFTTNYDLLLYWSVMKDPGRFVDFFWSREFNFAFDVTNVGVSGRRTMLFYIHGALMLSENQDGHVAKIVNTDSHPVLLDSILERIAHGDFPVFVSEGDSQAKLRSVAGYTYLDFCLARLGKSSQPTVVYGHGLGNVDAHIVSALARSPRKLFAVGLWPRSSSAVENERARIEAALGAKAPDGSPRTIRYFDGRTLNAWTGAVSPAR